MNSKEQNKKLISPFIVDQIPAYISLTFGDSTVEGGALFTRFLQLYYEWLETSYTTQISDYSNRSISAYSNTSILSLSNPDRPEVGNQYDRLKRLKSFRDIDSTIEPLVRHFRSEYMPDLPYDIKSNKFKLLKLMKEIYTIRGTAEGFDVLFRAIYGKRAKLYIPKDYKVFSPSESGFEIQTVIRIVVPGGTDDTLVTDFPLTTGFYAVGETTGVKIAVGGVNKNIYVGTTLLTELVVDRSTLSIVDSNLIPTTTVKYDEFKYNEYLKFINSEGGVVNNATGTPLRAKIKSSITGITMTNEGSGYKIDDSVTFTGTSSGVRAEINSLSPGKVEELRLESPGTNYKDTSASANPPATNPKISLVSRYFELYGDISYDGTKFNGFIPGSTLTTDRGSDEATADIRLREGNKLYIDNINGTFITDEISKKDYGSEVVKTVGHVDTYTVGSESSNWASGGSATYYDLEQSSTTGNGKGLVLTIEIASGTEYSTTVISSGYGYALNEVVTFQEPTGNSSSSPTLPYTIISVKDYTGRLDRLVDFGGVDGSGTVIAANDPDPSIDPSEMYIYKWRLDEGGSGYLEPPPAYALNISGVSTAQFSSFGSHIGGVKSIKLTSMGLADETTAVVLKDTSEKNLYLDAEFTIDDYRVGDTVYQGDLDDEDATTGVVVGTNSKPLVSQLNILKITNSTGTWAAAADVKNTRTSASVTTLPAGAIAEFEDVYDGTGWISQQSNQAITLQTLELSSITGTFTVGEVVYQGSIGSETAIGKVSKWTSPDLEVTTHAGTFATSVTVTDGTNNGTVDTITGNWDVTYGTTGGTHRLYFQAATAFTVGNWIHQGLDWISSADALAIVDDVSHQDTSPYYITITDIWENAPGHSPPADGEFEKNTLIYEVPFTYGRIATFEETTVDEYPWLSSTWVGSSSHSDIEPYLPYSTTNGTGAVFDITLSAGEPTFTIQTESTNEGQRSKGSGYAVGDELFFFDPSGSEHAILRVATIVSTSQSISRGTTIDNDNFLSGHSDSSSLVVNRKTAIADMGTGFINTDKPVLTDVGYNATESQEITLLKVPQDGTETPFSNTWDKAAATVQYGAIVDKIGVHKTRSSHLNEEPRVSDGVEYQKWSYGVQTAVNPEEWLKLATDLFHPAGTTIIPNFVIDIEHDTTLTTTTTVTTTVA